jgi:hypothetical protein
MLHVSNFEGKRGLAKMGEWEIVRITLGCFTNEGLYTESKLQNLRSNSASQATYFRETFPLVLEIYLSNIN